MVFDRSKVTQNGKTNLLGGTDKIDEKNAGTMIQDGITTGISDASQLVRIKFVDADVCNSFNGPIMIYATTKSYEFFLLQIL